jgi:hypothetical protein
LTVPLVGEVVGLLQGAAAGVNTVTTARTMGHKTQPFQGVLSN